MLRRIAYLWSHRFWNRTPAKWVAILLDSGSNFAVVDGRDGKQLPFGLVDGTASVQQQCYEGLALNQESFSEQEPLHLIEIAGRGRDEFTFYFAGRMLDSRNDVLKFKKRVKLLSRPDLKLFVPGEVDQRVGL